MIKAPVALVVVTVTLAVSLGMPGAEANSVGKHSGENDSVLAVAPQIPLVNAEGKRALLPGESYERRYELMKDWRGQVMTYWVNLPEHFDPERRYPILFEWHGKSGGPKTQLFPGFYGVDDHIHVGLTYPLGCDSGSAPLYPTEEYVAFIRHVYDDVVDHFRGDGAYVFMGGFSAGGFMTTGPAIALMIRAGLRDALAGVLAGGCNWMCDPRYARGVHVLLWYGQQDTNSLDLPRRLPELRQYATSLEVIVKPGGHRCDREIEGPAIHRFLRLHGPDAASYERLDAAKAAFEAGKKSEAAAICQQLRTQGGPPARFATELMAEYPTP
jgi:hypothetical protein